jgi:hypothetical protein
MLKEDSVELHILIGSSDRLGENANGLWKGHVVMEIRLPSGLHDDSSSSCLLNQIEK